MGLSPRLRKHLVAALLAGLALRLFFVWHFPFVAGDTKFYEELARNWVDHGVYGVFIHGTLTPTDMRAPGYPAFLVAVYSVAGRTPLAARVTQALLDLVTCALIAAIAARIAPASRRTSAAMAALWLAALCPFTADYSAALLTEVLAIFLTALAVLFLLRADEAAASLDRNPAREAKTWFCSGLLIGLGTLVRPETPLLLAAIGLVLCARWRRRADWARLALAVLWMAAGMLLPMAPWAARNAHTLGRVQFLAPRYAETFGDFVPEGFYAWTKTWQVRFRDAYQVIWKVGKEPLRMEAFPAAAFDSESERARVAAWLAQYNQDGRMTPALDARFARLARERTARHPWRTRLWVPLERAAVMWFTPRIELLPYSGRLWPPAQRWHDNHADFLVTAGFGLLNVGYFSLSLWGAWRCRAHPAVAWLATYLLLRTAVLTQMQTVEPRYVLECFPVVLALGAAALAGTSDDVFPLEDWNTVESKRHVPARS